MARAKKPTKPSRLSKPSKPGGSARWEKDLPLKLWHFANKWKSYEGTEQAGSQSFLTHLLDIYEISFKPGTIFEQHPVRVPAKRQGLFGDEGETVFTTERMDMYLPKICVWEMKNASEKDLAKHHPQLLAYWARMRPRFMVLCNFHEFWIYDTNDEQGQLVPKLKLDISQLTEFPYALSFVRGEDPDLETRSERVTAEMGRALGRLVRQLVEKAGDGSRERERITKLMLQCVFAMFAEDSDLIQPGMFSEALKLADEAGRLDPILDLFEDFSRKVAQEKSHRLAPYVNGPLFDTAQPRMELDADQIHGLYRAARDFDWQDVRPEIFGSIFEQALDPVQRHELGAHFTREADIVRVVGPTVIEPWRERVAALRSAKQAEALIEEMKAFHVLDPACGCGNFLYVIYREMKRLEATIVERWEFLQRKIVKRRQDIKPPPPGPYFTIRQLHGIEREPFAAFLARVVLWIGEHLANRELGLDDHALPLKNLDDTIRAGDALTLDWPRPEGELAIVGNPPYLGVRKMRRELGDEYVDDLFERYPDNRAADYVTYWFARALRTLRPNERAGFVCTNSVAQNESREASIDRIAAAGGTITEAWRSYPWPGEAAVHIGIVNWIMAPWEGVRRLDGQEVVAISPSLTLSVDVTVASHLAANDHLCFMGVTPGNNEFVLDEAQRAEILAADPKSADVIRPFLIGRDVNREIDQKPTRWIIDFGTMSKEEAEAFPGAMRHVRKHVYPARRRNTRESGSTWWQFRRPRPALRRAIEGLDSVLVLPRVSPRTIVSRQETTATFDCQLMVVALSDPYHFGVLQSRIHEIWARARGSTLKGDLRYTNTTVFETFPFPWDDTCTYNPRRVPRTAVAQRLSKAAGAFDRLRSAECREHELGLTKVHNKLDAGELPELAAAWEELNDAATACYGFPAGAWRDERETLRLLLELNRRCAFQAAEPVQTSLPLS